jgi:hypothetical protein
LVIANQRIHRTTGSRPAEIVATERQATGSLPPVDPVISHRFTTGLARDYYVTAAGAAYSVHLSTTAEMCDPLATVEN